MLKLQSTRAVEKSDPATIWIRSDAVYLYPVSGKKSISNSIIQKKTLPKVWSCTKVRTRTPCPSSTEVDPTLVPEETQMPKNNWKKTLDQDVDVIDLTWSEATELTEEYKEWNSCSAQCAVRARGWD